jgi:hypothetical protein
MLSAVSLATPSSPGSAPTLAVALRRRGLPGPGWWLVGLFLVVVSGQRNQRAWRLPSVHLPAYDHGEADLELDQRHHTLPVRPTLQRVVFLDRGLVMLPTSLPGVRSEELIPGRLQLIEVPVPPGGLEVGRRQVRPLP